MYGEVWNECDQLEGKCVKSDRNFLAQLLLGLLLLPIEYLSSAIGRLSCYPSEAKVETNYCCYGKLFSKLD